MEASALLDAHVQLKRLYTSMNEAMDITRQLAEAVDRDDQVAIHMLVAMRQEPVDKMSQAKRTLEMQRDALPEGDRVRLEALLKGGPPEDAGEEAFVKQVGMNDRLLKQLADLDRVLNRKLTRDKSIYQ